MATEAASLQNVKSSLKEAYVTSRVWYHKNGAMRVNILRKQAKVPV
jgi:hypothetical protein